jgi:low temperature requirement protein LtrA
MPDMSVPARRVPGVSVAAPRPSRLATVKRGDDSRVVPLELFFDLVFVLALTQCTALMAAEPTWAGLAKGLLVLGVLWWAWVGYSWLTSVVDPEEGAVRLVMFGAMAAMLVVALAVPEAFTDAGLVFAGGYLLFRGAHILLFLAASGDDPGLRRSVVGLAVSTTIGVSLLVAAAFADGPLQGALWALALAFDAAGPLAAGVEGWRLVPGHFAERHGLVLIIALGESIVAIGVGAEGIDVGDGIVTAAVLGTVVAAALWWLYFDVVARVAEHRLSGAAGRERNAMARDAYSYLHFPMVAGIVLVALGLKKTLGDVGEPLKVVPAVALLGGAALYLLAHVAFRWRNMRTVAPQRIVSAVLLVVLVPVVVAAGVPALATVGALAAVLVALVAYESTRYAEARAHVRHGG